MTLIEIMKFQYFMDFYDFLCISEITWDTPTNTTVTRFLSRQPHLADYGRLLLASLQARWAWLILVGTWDISGYSTWKDGGHKCLSEPDQAGRIPACSGAVWGLQWSFRDPAVTFWGGWLSTAFWSTKMETLKIHSKILKLPWILDNFYRPHYDLTFFIMLSKGEVSQYLLISG